MKLNLKISARERWFLALAPAVAIVGVYLFGFSDGLSAEVSKQQKRLQAAQTPLPPPPPSAALAKAKSALEEATRGIADKEKHIATLEEHIAAARGTAAADDNAAPARVIEKVEAVFARNGITPLISEAAGGTQTGNQAPATLVTLLSPKTNGDATAVHTDSRVWHCVFDGPTAKFERAVRELAAEAPTVVPLSLNLVYNPENDGETRLLELWLVY